MPTGMRPTDAARSWCEEMLPRVSRTFALCIRFLPPDVREPVLLSYLLCRIADTIEDHPRLPAERKRDLLAEFAASLAAPSAAGIPAIEAQFAAAGDADGMLVRHGGRVLAVFAAQPRPVREVVVPWIQEMCRGMAEFAPRRVVAPGDDGRGLRALATERDLDTYCYYVAGTVGHLLTSLFGCLRPQAVQPHLERLDALAESFGAGLQLTNIIVDAAEDQRRGVSYVPEELCRREGLASGEWLVTADRARARAVIKHLVRKARGHLADALQYCEVLPRLEYQLRLFCVVPVFLALRTLREVEGTADFPAPGQRVKIGRAAVARTVAAARFCASSNHLVRVYAHHLQF